MMRGDRFRFRPPELELSPALRWALVRAYAPADMPSTLPPPDRARALEWSTSLVLRERIASRSARTRVADELGDELAEELWRARDALAARALLLRQLLDKVAARAAELDCPLVVLKGMALLESGAASWGARPLVDLDLMPAPDRASELAASLRDLGLRPTGPDERHHLPPLADPRLGELELHLSLPGVSLDNSRITPERLLDAGLVEPSSRPAHPLLPRPALLTAHLIAHAVDQHGLSPTAYPITRLIADLLDLSEALGRPVAELARDASRLLAQSVSVRELGAVATLSEQLAAGTDPDTGDDDARALLVHSLAAIRLPGYRRGLRRRAALRAVARADWRKLRPRPGPAGKD